MKLLPEIILGYLLLVLGMFVFQRSFMYFPDTTKPEPIDGMQAVNFLTSDEINISGWFVPTAQRSDKVIVFFHGNAGHAAHRIYKAALYVHAGYSVMLAEYRGYGGNEGRPTEEGFYKDARAQIDYLINQKGYSEEQIILYGESIGSGVAVQMAQEYKGVHALILETPFSSMVDVAMKRYFYVPVRLLLLDRYDSASKISSIDMPVLIGHGKKDNVVPYASARHLYDKVTSQEKRFLDYDDGNHNNLYQYGFGGDVLKFLSGIDGDNEDNEQVEILTEE